MYDHLMILTYGPSGVGKTTDMGYSFPTALFVAAPGALLSIKSTCGYEPASTSVNNLDDLAKVLESAGEKYDWIVIDDFSFLAEQTMAVYERGGPSHRMWSKLRDAVLKFRDVARYCKASVVLNAWEQAPKTRDSGERVRGGPMLAGRLPEQVPAMCDLVLRAGVVSGRKPWPGAYFCAPSPDWVMKDRTNVAQALDPAPMNLAEILRTRIPVPRLPGMEWAEEVVEQMAVILREDMEKQQQHNGVNGFVPVGAVQAPGSNGISALAPREKTPSVKLINELYRKLVAGGVPTTAAKWAVRDAIDRAMIQSKLAKREEVFIVEEPRSGLAPLR